MLRIAAVRGSLQRRFSTSAFRSKDVFLAGTAPSYSCYILLHSSLPPSSFPSKLMTPLQRELQLRVLQWGGFVNWVYYGANSHGVDPTQYHESVSATAFTSYGEKIEISDVSRSSMDEVDETLQRRVAIGKPETVSVDEIQLLVCTHMARDCRCGELGGAYIEAMKKEIENRRKSNEELYSKLKIGQVGHVGQHKFAPNLLVYPRGDWLGQVQIKDIPETLDSIVQTSAGYPFPTELGFPKDIWRGRMNLSKEEQLDLYHSV